MKSLGNISHEIILSNNLKWPKYGNKFVILSLLYYASVCVSTSTWNRKFILNLGQPIQTLVPCIIGQMVSIFFSFFMTFNMILFVLIWIEQFGATCTKFYVMDVEIHVQKCLYIMETLQNGLGKFIFVYKTYFHSYFHSGTTLFLCFLCFQISTITFLFMTISVHLSTIYEPWQNIVNSVSNFISAIYCTSTLYFITMTTESSFDNLKKLVEPLQQKIVQEKDATEQLKIKMVIEKVDNVKTLNGNGYFEISRATLTSIVSISITYLIILLQFRTA